MLRRGEADPHAESVLDVRFTFVFVRVGHFVSLLSSLLSLLRKFDRVYSVLLSPEATEFMTEVSTPPSKKNPRVFVHFPSGFELLHHRKDFLPSTTTHHAY